MVIGPLVYSIRSQSKSENAHLFHSNSPRSIWSCWLVEKTNKLSRNTSTIHSEIWFNGVNQCSNHGKQSSKRRIFVLSYSKIVKCVLISEIANNASQMQNQEKPIRRENGFNLDKSARNGNIQLKKSRRSIDHKANQYSAALRVALAPILQETVKGQ